MPEPRRKAKSSGQKRPATHPLPTAAGQFSAPRSGSGRRFGSWPGVLGALLLLGLVSCGPRTAVPPPLPQLVPPEDTQDRVSLTPVSFADLPGWTGDSMAEALPALRRSCDKMTEQPPFLSVGRDGQGGVINDWLGPCAALTRLEQPSALAVRLTLEAWFQPFRVANKTRSEGTFTGYYEAELKGARRRGGIYQTPLYPRPDDLPPDPGGQDPRYLSRTQIEGGALSARLTPLLWVEDPVDAHILQIQGSGRVRLPDGTVMRVGYHGHNGHPFVGLGRILRDHGKLDENDGSMQAIRRWLKTHPAESRALMAENPRYIFFREIRGDGPIGAAGVPLTAGRSLAVDPRFIPFGAPLWLNTRLPDGKPLQRLMVAQDMGAAIKGPVRGDVFWGSGESALEIAGRMKSRGEYYILLPKQRSAVVGSLLPDRDGPDLWGVLSLAQTESNDGWPRQDIAAR